MGRELPGKCPLRALFAQNVVLLGSQALLPLRFGALDRKRMGNRRRGGGWGATSQQQSKKRQQQGHPLEFGDSRGDAFVRFSLYAKAMAVDWSEDEYLLLYIQQQDVSDRWACYLNATPEDARRLLETRRRMPTPALRDLAIARLRMARRQWRRQALCDSQRAPQPLLGNVREDQVSYLRPLARLAALAFNLATEPQIALQRQLQRGLGRALTEQWDWLSCSEELSDTLCRQLGKSLTELERLLLEAPQEGASWLVREALGEPQLLTELVGLSPLAPAGKPLGLTAAQRACCFRALTPEIAGIVRLSLSNEALWELTAALRHARGSNPLVALEREFRERANLPSWLTCEEWRQNAPGDYARGLLELIFGEKPGRRRITRQEPAQPPYTRTQLACRELLIRLEPQFTANVLLLLPLPATHRVLSAMFSAPSGGDSSVLLAEALDWGRWATLEEVMAAGPDGLAERVEELFAVGCEADAEALELLGQLPLERRCECLRSLSHLRYLQVAGAL
jgi:hypothetical protein